MKHFSFREDDPFSPIRYEYEVDRVLCARRTKYQELLVFESPQWGRVLALDNVLQLTENDEYYYHEMISQVAMHAHPSPQEVLIIGGGDGGTLREVLKHQNVKRASLVELDSEVIAVSKEFFPTLSSSFADPRARILEMDGAEFLAESGEDFDVIIVDSTDPVGPAEVLFSKEFFAKAATALRTEGILVIQTESLHFHRDFICGVQQKLGEIFKTVDLYTVPLATYAGNWWTFSIASKTHDPRDLARSHDVPTRYYSEDVHRHAFLPRSLYNKMMGED